MSTQQKKTSQKGFTLVEIAIVLVIIGLLLGGVLKGQELIQNSKVKATQSEIQQWAAAVYTYQDKTGKLPGDDPNTSLPHPGDGDGTIDNAERAPLFEDLKLEGLVKGNYDGTNYATNKWGGDVIIDDNQAGMSGLAVCYDGLDKETSEELDRKLDDGNSATGDVRRSNQATAYTDTNNNVCFKM